MLALRGTAANSTSQHLIGIAHVALRTGDLPASLRFYESLGFVRAFEFTKNGTPSEEFVKINDREFIELYPRSQPEEAIGLMHVCFESDDLPALQRAYVQAGVPAPDVKRAGAGNDLFSLAGPDGSVIEFTQYMTGSLHSKDAGQHLGQDRISSGLAGVLEPVGDPQAMGGFYHNKLGFPLIAPPSAVDIHVPSNPDLTIGFRPPSTRLRMTFKVASLRETVAQLRDRHISFATSPGGLMTTDPDGNEVVFSDHP